MLMVLCYCINLNAQNLNISPAKDKHATSDLLLNKIIYGYNLSAAANASANWTGFSQNPLSANISAHFLPQNTANGLLFGAEILLDAYGPFRNYAFLPSVSVVRADRNFQSGYFLGLRPGITATSFLPGSLVWRDDEPQQFEHTGGMSADISYEAGAWLSFDRKRKFLMFGFQSDNTIGKYNKASVFSRIFSGSYQVKWVSLAPESRTETSYELQLTELRNVTHTVSFRYYSPVGLYGALSLNSQLNSACQLGYRWQPASTNAVMLDAGYTFAYSLARYGPLAGNSHGLLVKIYHEL